MIPKKSRSIGNYRNRVRKHKRKHFKTISQPSIEAKKKSLIVKKYCILFAILRSGERGTILLLFNCVCGHTKAFCVLEKFSKYAPCTVGT